MPIRDKVISEIMMGKIFFTQYVFSRLHNSRTSVFSGSPVKLQAAGANSKFTRTKQVYRNLCCGNEYFNEGFA
jgi:hypothetical protein